MKNKILSYIKYLCWSFPFVLAQTGVAFAKRCKAINEYIRNGTGDNFVLTRPFEIISEVSADVANYSWNSFSGPLQGVVVVCVAVYVAGYVLKNVGSFSKQDTLSFLTKEKGGVLPLCAKMAFIVALLNNQEFIYSTIIAPFVTSSLLLGNELGGGSSAFSDASFGGTNSVGDLFNIVTEQAKELNSKIYTIVAKGQFLFCVSTNPESIWGIFAWEWKLLPFALILFVIGWFIVIGASFNLLDILIRLGVGCIILPIAIACSITRYTSGYSKKTWQLFINCCFSFIVIGMLVLIANEIIVGILDVAAQKAGSDNILRNLDSVPSKSQVEDFADGMKGSFFKLITLTIICSMIILNMFNDIESITSAIAGGGRVGDMAGKVGGTAVNKLQQAAREPVKFVGQIAKEGGKMVGETEAGQAVKRGVNKARTAVKKFFRIKN